MEIETVKVIINGLTFIIGSIGARLLFKRTNIAETSQVNEQYIKSIEQLGKDSISGRLGGIYGLEKVAKSQRFYKQVIEVLTAYVRQHTVYVRQHADEPKVETYHQTEKDKPVIQAILTVLGRLPRPKKYKETVPFDLSGAYLEGYKIQGDFSRSIFTGADFFGADCGRANFTEAYCRKANFTGAWCIEANFTEAYCSRANFTQADCREANFTKADCQEADFIGADCYEANFTEAWCTGAKGVTEAMKQTGAIYL